MDVFDAKERLYKLRLVVSFEERMERTWLRFKTQFHNVSYPYLSTTLKSFYSFDFEGIF